MTRKTPTPPPGLARLQSLFGQSIRTPFSFSTGRFQCRKEEYPDWADLAIASRKERTGRERLAIYNEQYWYRLLTVLQQDFPLLARTLGLWEFNQLASAFLDRHPSRSPFLHDLADGFVEFLGAEATLIHPRLVQIAALETACLRAFHAPGLPPLNPDRLTPDQREALHDTPLILQPWLTLLEEDWNLMACRISGEDREKVAPPFLDRKGYWAIYRKGLEVAWHELEPAQFDLLHRLRSGYSLGSACEAMAENREAADLESLMAGIPAWFETWTRLQWFAHPVPEAPSLEGLVEGRAEVV